MSVIRPFASSQISLIAIFAAMIAVLDTIPMFPSFNSGVWDSWIFLLSPLVGIVLGPVAGAISVGIGTLVGHFIYFRDPFELLFMIGAPVGAMVSGLVYKGRWHEVMAIYTMMFIAYFLTPVTWVLPIWGIWDTFGAYLFLIALSLWVRYKEFFDFSSHRTNVVLCTFFGLEADILTRIFLFIPCQTYWLFYGLTSEQLVLLWAIAGFITPLKVFLAAVLTIIIGCPILTNLPAPFDRCSQNTNP